MPRETSCLEVANFDRMCRWLFFFLFAVTMLIQQDLNLVDTWVKVQLHYCLVVLYHGWRVVGLPWWNAVHSGRDRRIARKQHPTQLVVSLSSSLFAARLSLLSCAVVCSALVWSSVPDSTSLRHLKVAPNHQWQALLSRANYLHAAVIAVSIASPPCTLPRRDALQLCGPLLRN